MAQISSDQAGGQNVVAFLDMIAASEIGSAMLAESDDGYNVLVGSMPGHLLTFASYADHPRIYNKACNSDAAGRYQIMAHWWPAYKKELNLPDFGPVSQDLYAIQQFREQHALPLILAGDFGPAVVACNKIWASLPGSQYGQHVNQMAVLQQAYVSAGGTLKDQS